MSVLANCYFLAVHVDLSKDNEEKLLQASGRMDLSVQALANAIIRAVNMIEVEEVVSVQVTRANGGPGASANKRMRSKRGKRFVFI